MKTLLRAALLVWSWQATAALPPPDLTGYRTVATAITTTMAKTNSAAAGQSGFLGIHVSPDPKGKLVIGEVGENSPAARAGARVGDVLLKLDTQLVASADALRDALQRKAPGDFAHLTVRRGTKSLDLLATLGATSRPRKVGAQRAVMGIRTGEVTDQGVPISSVTTGMPADKAGLKASDVILKVAGSVLAAGQSVSELLAEKSPGDKVSVVVRRKGEEQEFQVTLTADTTTTTGEEPRVMWKKPGYKLAIIGVEFPDTRHNPAVSMGEWEQAMFSTGSYTKTNATGQTVYGSLTDYFLENSVGKLRVDGRAFDWLEMGKKRGDYSQAASTTAKTAFLTEAIDLLLKRDGTNALKDFDGIAFIYAGDRYPNVNRGSLYWPHRGSVTYKGKRWPYFICAEGGRRMGNISVYCHEFGHMLGIPDLYARPENPGSEGLGNWCAMSNQTPYGRPQHFGAWCKEQLGWLAPAVLDPTVKQKLVLAPIEGSTNECFKVLIRPDGSEYLLLENRRKTGFDGSLPDEGLLIWRIVGNRVILEESHGVEGPSGPRMFLTDVPYPSPANDAYTPFTTPSSRSLLGGGLPVHITNIRQHPDGRVSFHLGYEYQ
ncbi:MAG: M6 family metalloprotease domain protein [Limisphaerales bacterium]|nr:MAG: M6 family metalloprotease domain protein [Limisphaerales bacterium]KAG0509351.1 MAG: M6 family metalloprotease domain protein [Limisphaerales bacterium]TXT52096.1 MAG: M6 family metalloprotease domain protein [Limisphaerales bacterium]